MASSWLVLGWAVALVVLSESPYGEAAMPLKAEGQAGFWNQLVVGGDQAYPDRIGGLTLKSNSPVASLVDRDSPQNYESRWDITMLSNRLAFVRGGIKSEETLAFSSDGHATFNGNMQIDGALRAKALVLEGPNARTFVVGKPHSVNLRVGSDAKYGWIKSDAGHLLLNPHSAKKLAADGVVVFSSEVPRAHLDVHEEVWLEKALKLGDKGDTSVSSSALTFGRGGGWAPLGEKWLSSLNEKAVHFGGGAVFGDRLGVGIVVSQPDFRLQVHDGHFVVSSDISRNLKGIATYVTPSASTIKAYDYTLKKPQSLRITGTRILINPGQTDGRTCIGCQNPEHHLQVKGNAYVNGNVLVNKNLHVTGNMHIDKVITPKVFIHSRAETPDYGRGLMIGNDLKNEHGTLTNMRLGYNKGYGWIQSHQAVPLAVNPFGGGTCISCSELSREDVELEVNGDALIDGELYVATLPTKDRKNANNGDDSDDETSGVTPDLSLLQESENKSRVQAKNTLQQELGSEHMDLVNAWASTAKLIKSNSKLLLARKKEIDANGEAIRRLESLLATKI